jgi:hypothetical protein
LNLNEQVQKHALKSQVDFIVKSRARMKEFFDVYYYQQHADVAKKGIFDLC